MEIGFELDNKKLCGIFKCGPQGGMRKSNKTKTFVIVSNHIKSIYDDRWIDEVFHYTGMGQNGNHFLETHHIIWLSKGGEDTIENTVALCPNCHRRIHVLDDSQEIKKLSHQSFS